MFGFKMDSEERKQSDIALETVMEATLEDTGGNTKDKYGDLPYMQESDPESELGLDSMTLLNGILNQYG